MALLGATVGGDKKDSNTDYPEQQEDLVNMQVESARRLLDLMKNRIANENLYMPQALSAVFNNANNQLNAPRNVVWAKHVFEPTLRARDKVDFTIPTGNWDTGATTNYDGLDSWGRVLPTKDTEEALVGGGADLPVLPGDAGGSGGPPVLGGEPPIPPAGNPGQPIMDPPVTTRPPEGTPTGPIFLEPFLTQGPGGIGIRNMPPVIDGTGGTGIDPRVLFGGTQGNVPTVTDGTNGVTPRIADLMGGTQGSHGMPPVIDRGNGIVVNPVDIYRGTQGSHGMPPLIERNSGAAPSLEEILGGTQGNHGMPPVIERGNGIVRTPADLYGGTQGNHGMPPVIDRGYVDVGDILSDTQGNTFREPTSAFSAVNKELVGDYTDTARSMTGRFETLPGFTPVDTASIDDYLNAQRGPFTPPTDLRSQVLFLHQKGTPINEIVRITGVSIPTIQEIVRVASGTNFTPVAGNILGGRG
jgi:hypothetical protein